MPTFLDGAYISGFPMTGASVGMGVQPCLSPDGIYAEGLLYISKMIPFSHIYI